MYEVTPSRPSFDVVIIGGAMMGSSVAWWLTWQEDFKGTILVVERDPTYEFSSTTRTNSCIRQQFSTELNIRISQFGAEFINDFRTYMGDAEAPEIPIHSYGYMYLADNEPFAELLRESCAVQNACGAETRIMSPDEIANDYPFYNLDGIIAGSHNRLNEGYFDGGTIFDWWKKKSRQKGAEYIQNEVVGIVRDGGRVASVSLASGETVAAGTVVNCAGPRASVIARMVGIELPVEPRRRYTFIFDAENPLDQDLPLTIDPSGVHVRSDGAYYLSGCPPDEDPAVGYDDFEMDHNIWEEKAWPAIATRIPAFEAVKVINTWVGHYAFNTLDHNAIIGFHPEVENLLFLNGFSGHGFQQSPAMGRGASELIARGNYQTLDLSPLGYERIVSGEAFIEKAVI